MPPISLERINQCHKMFCIEIVAKRRECLRLLLLVGCGQMCPENEIVQIKSTFFHIFIHKNQFLSIVLLLSKNKLFSKSANYFRKKSSIIDVRLGSKHNSTLGYRTRISGMRFEVLVWQTCVGYKCIAFLDPPTGSEGKKFKFCKFLQAYY